MSEDKRASLSSGFFSNSERAVLLLLRVQLALRSRRVPKRYIADTLSEHGLNSEGAIESLERMGYILSVGYRGSYVMLTTKGAHASVGLSDSKSY